MNNYTYTKSDILGLSSVKGYGSAKIIKTIVNSMPVENFSEVQKIGLDMLAKLDILGVSFVTYLDEDYPASLRQISDPPAILYFKGDISLLNSALISIVGTRKMSMYGRKITEILTQDLVKYGFVVVSGMAMGIDAIAHKSTFGTGGKTIAVLASSADVPTPSTNANIYNNILENGGLILSEYFPGTAIYPGMFAARNRIVAAISSAVVVIEAPIKSGSLITAQLALDYNKEVFAVPGSIFDKNFEGTNKLIAESSAYICRGINDILDKFGHKINSTTKIEKPDLKDEELDVYNALLVEAQNLDSLSFNLRNNNVSSLLHTLSTLELKGIVQKNESGNYFINNLANI